MALILLTLVILYFLLILIRSFSFIDNNRVQKKVLARTALLAMMVPLGLVVGALLERQGLMGAVNFIGWTLYLFVPYIARLLIYGIVYIFRDRKNPGALL
ncbi:hypothetical protein [Luteithermobacter gelatinilyticus]|uniref:hypothetical protein n=1 Tax=Luteithermobacter gelatinilyticus TaxID=2582913 RepID=UPI001106CFF1|nr:hypothetical protein [Luteithermobacter gelatinilyticus]